MRITCKKATELVVKKEEGNISLWQHYQLQRHIAICKLCRLFAKQNHLISLSIKHSGTQLHLLSDTDKDAIVKAINDGGK